MSQPREDESGATDPLLAFFVESEPAISAGSGPPPKQPEPPKPVKAVDPVAERLARAEAEIKALRSELATLVGTVADIKKRLSRRPEPAVPVKTNPPMRALGSRSAVAAVIVGIALGVMGWRVLNDAAVDLPAPRPAVVASTPALEPRPVAVALPATPASPRLEPAVTPVSAPVSDQPAANREQPLPTRDQPAREATRRIDYFGTVSIDSDPDGEVFFDRKPAGRTPVRLERVRAGSHLVWIERDGYRRWTRVVQVPADRVSRVSAGLEPIAR